MVSKDTVFRVIAVVVITASFVLMAYMDTDSALYQHLPRP